MAEMDEHFLLRGGLDLVTPSLAIQPGYCISALNYEPVERGYRRADGYEAFDGRLPPTEAPYTYLRFKGRDLTRNFAVGDVVRGTVSGAQGRVIGAQNDPEGPATIRIPLNAATRLSLSGVLDVPISAKFIDVSAPPVDTGHIAMAQVTGTFLLDEALSVSGVSIAVSASLPEQNVAPTLELDLTYRLAAQDRQRLNLSSVPGQGRVCGVWIFKNDVYAFRNKTGGAACGMYRATSAGWAEMSTGAEVIPAVPAGRVMTFANYAFANHAFGRAERMYVTIGGGGRAFEWNGSVFRWVTAIADASLDKPTLLTVYSNHLFLLYDSGSMLFSEIGNPLAWTTTGGAGEIVLGSKPQDVISSADTALIAICRTRIIYLTGQDKANFTRQELSSEHGGWTGTAQFMGRLIYADQRGLRDIGATDTLAGFSMGTISQQIAPIFRAHEKAKIKPRASIRCLAKDQYRLFMSDKTCIVAYFGRKYPEFTQLDLPIQVTCACSDASTEESAFAGTERMFVGSDDGWVYQLDRGTTFNGQHINASIRMPFNQAKYPIQNKRFHTADVEVDAEGGTSLGMGFEFDYSNGERSSGRTRDLEVVGGGGYWSEARWSNFNWSSPVSGSLTSRIDGIGLSCSILVGSRSIGEPSHTLTAMRIGWSPRGKKR